MSEPAKSLGSERSITIYEGDKLVIGVSCGWWTEPAIDPANVRVQLNGNEYTLNLENKK